MHRLFPENWHIFRAMFWELQVFLVMWSILCTFVVQVIIYEGFVKQCGHFFTFTMAIKKLMKNQILRQFEGMFDIIEHNFETSWRFCSAVFGHHWHKLYWCKATIMQKLLSVECYSFFFNHITECGYYILFIVFGIILFTKWYRVWVLHLFHLWQFSFDR